MVCRKDLGQFAECHDITKATARAQQKVAQTMILNFYGSLPHGVKFRVNQDKSGWSPFSVKLYGRQARGLSTDYTKVWRKQQLSGQYQSLRRTIWCWTTIRTSYINSNNTLGIPYRELLLVKWSGSPNRIRSNISDFKLFACNVG